MVLPRAARPRRLCPGRRWVRARADAPAGAGRFARGRPPVARAGRRRRWPSRSTVRPGPGWSRWAASPLPPRAAGRRAGTAFRPPSLHVPELSLARRGAEALLTVNLLVGTRRHRSRSWPPGLQRSARRLCARGAAAARSGPDRPLPRAQPDAAVALRGGRRPGGAAHPRRRAREGRAGPRGRGPRARASTTRRRCIGVLREAYPSCYVFAVGRGEATFLAASPELLVRREGQRASTVALAGSTRRSADPAVDDHLGEQLRQSDKDREENAIVARRIARALRPHAVWVTAAPEPSLVRVANIQHLARPIRAQLAAPLDAVAAGRPAASHARRGWRAGRRGRAADPRSRGAGSRLVCRRGGVGRRHRRRRVLRGPALRAAARAAARTCTPAAGSSATPSRPPSWPRPRSSSARCCRCWPG